MHNVEGFIFNQTSVENVYCLSNEAIVTIIDKSTLVRMFKT
jgi:hypothetical protein